MNCCSETTKMDVPARHREPARSGEAGGPPGNRPAVPRDWSETYLNGTSQGELVLSHAKEGPRTPGRTAISVVAASHS